ncbi:hypothetical protein UPYG_G00257000 [Umbra pygmaea]
MSSLAKRAKLELAKLQHAPAEAQFNRPSISSSTNFFYLIRTPYIPQCLARYFRSKQVPLQGSEPLVFIIGNMVNVLKGVLVECDPAMKQFLLYLDETSALGKKFIIQDLDDTHVFILAEVVQILQERVGELMDQNSFPITQK